MKVYLKFFTLIYLKSLFYVFFIILSLVFILNILTELEFFKDTDVSLLFTITLSLINSPSMIFEMSPFILLLTIQLFFIKLFENHEIEIFKYSGLKNSKILLVISILTFLTGIFSVLIFYNISSQLKNIYLEMKSNYVTDGKYLAVVTKNGLWIKDKINNKIIITNSSSINENYILDNFITVFDENFNVSRNILSKKIDISKKNWKVLNARIYEQNYYTNRDSLEIQTNFDLDRIKTLYSNLSALNLYQLWDLRKNYKKLNNSTTDLDLHMYKLFSHPIYLLLISIFSALIMFRIKKFKGSTFKILTGLFFSVIIYYINNFSYVLGSTEKISLWISVFIPLISLSLFNSYMINKINEK